jgi:hypothetical protein
MQGWWDRLSEVRIGLLFALLTGVFGFGLGGAFGGFEDQIKRHLDAEAASVRDLKYGGDEDGMKKVTEKSWVYLQRAHLHANGLSAASLALIVLVASLPVDRRVKAANAAALGIGSLGYAVFWMLAAFRAPAMGSGGAAKESLQWLAVPASGLCILGLVVVTVLAARCLFFSRSAASDVPAAERVL